MKVSVSKSDRKGKKLKIVLDLRSEDWGQKHFSVEDPNGIYLDVVQAIEPTEEYQSGYVKEQQTTTRS